MPTQAVLTTVPLPMNPAVEGLFGKLESMLGPKACLKGSSETYFRYATKGEDVLLVSLKLRHDNGYSSVPGSLRLTLRLASIGDPKAFPFGYRRTDGGFNRLAFAEYTIARGNTTECLNHLADGVVLGHFAAWLDAKVAAAGATPQGGLIETLAAVYLAGIKPVVVQPVVQPVVDFEKGFVVSSAMPTPPTKSVKNTEEEEPEDDGFGFDDEDADDHDDGDDE
jgi:hypothetical protein